MSKATATLALGAVLKSGTKSVFKAISAGLKDIGTELERTAKDMYKMGKTDAADAVGHVSGAFKRLHSEVQQYNKEGKKVADTTKGIAAPMKDMGKQMQVVQDAWKFMTKGGAASETAMKGHTKWVGRLDSALGNISASLKSAGVSERKWAKSLDWTRMKLALQKGDLQLVGNKLKVLNAVGRSALGLNIERMQALEKLGKSQTIYQKQLGIGVKKSQQYVTAVRSLGKQTLYNNQQAKIWAPALDKVNSALNNTTFLMKAQKGGLVNLTKKWDMASISNQVLAGNVRATAQGFQILNDKGLKPFTGLSASAAESLGMLSRGFTKVKLKSYSERLTEYGKALRGSSDRSAKFRRELGKTADTLGSTGKVFKTRYDDIKKSDDIWRKHTDSLRHSGKITTETMHKMNAGFNASRVSAKELAKVLDAPTKRFQTLKRTIATVAVETKQSVKSLDAQANAMVRSGKSTADVQAILRKQISAYRELDKLESKRADVTGKSVESIQKVSRANIERAKTGKLVVASNSDVVKSQGQVLHQIDLAVKSQDAQLKAEKGVIDSRKNATRAIRSVTDQYKEAVRGSADLRKNLRSLHQAYSISSEKGNRLTKVLQMQAKGIDAAGRRVGLFARAMKSLVIHLKSFASYAAAASVIAGFVQTLRAATSAVIDFDQSLKDLQAITSATDREVGLMGKKILQVASTTKFSAQEVAAGMKTLGQAGLSASEAVQTMQAVADLATGTLSDMSTTVDLVTTAMRVFDIGASESAHVSDVFANAVNRSKLTVDKLRIAMNYVGPVAARAGISFEEVASSMMLLANSGIRASTIGTGLRQVFRKLVDPSKDLKAAVQAVGMTMDDLNPKYHSMREIIENLGEVVISAEDAFTMFGMRGASAISAMTAQGVSGFDAMWKSVNRFGSAAKMAEKQMEGLGVKIKNMYDKAKNLAIALGKTGLAGALHLVVDSARLSLDAVTSLTNSLGGTLLIQITGITAALVVLYAAFKAFAGITFVNTFFTSILGVFSLLPTRIGLAVLSMNAYSASVNGAAVATNGLAASLYGAAVAFASTGIGAVVLVIGALITTIASAVMWSKRFERVQQKEIDTSKNLADSYHNQVVSIDKLMIKLAKLEKGSDGYNISLLDTRGKLLKVAEANTRLSRSALKAAHSIHPLTGELQDQGKILKAYAAEAEKLELEQMGESFALVSRKIEGTFPIWKRASDYIKRLGVDSWNSIKRFNDALLILIKTMSGPVISDLKSMRYFVGLLASTFGITISKWEELKNSLSGFKIPPKVEEFMAKLFGLKAKGDPAIGLLDAFKEGSSTWDELNEAMDGWAGAETDGIIELRSALTDVKIAAGEILEKMQSRGDILLADTPEDIIKTANELGLITGEIKLQEAAIKSLAAVKQKAARESALGTSEKLARDFDKEWSDYERYLNKSIGGIDDLQNALGGLSQDKIKNQKKDQETIRKEVDDIKGKLATEKAYLKEGTLALAEADKKARRLRVSEGSDPDLIKKKQLLLAAQGYEEGLAAHKAKFERQTEITRENLTEELAITQKFQNEVQKIRKGTFDIAALRLETKQRVAIEKETLAGRKKALELKAVADPEGEERGEYSKKAAAAEKKTAEQIVAIYQDMHSRIVSTYGETSKYVVASGIKLSQAKKKFTEVEIDELIVLSKAKKQASDADYAMMKDNQERASIALEAHIIEQQRLLLGVENAPNMSDEDRMQAGFAIEKEISRLRITSKKDEINELVGLNEDYSNEIAQLANELSTLQLDRDDQNTDHLRESALKQLAALESLWESGGTSAEVYFQKIDEMMRRGVISEEEAIAEIKSIRDAELQDELDASEYKWRRGKMEAEEFRRISQEARDANLIDEEEYNNRMMASTSNMFKAMKFGWDEARSNVKNFAELAIELGEKVHDLTRSNAEEAVESWLDGTKSLKNAFKDFIDGVIKDFARLAAQQGSKMIIQTIMGGGGDKTIFGFAGGGEIPGSSPHSKADNIPINATAGEFMHPVEAVKHYGLEFMEAVRTLQFPKVKSGYAYGGRIVQAVSKGYSDGGKIASQLAQQSDVSMELNINNESGTDVQAESSEPKFDGEKWVLDIVLSAVGRNRRGFRNNLKGALG